MRRIRTVVDAATIDIDSARRAEHIQHGGYLRREETNAAILEHTEAGATIRDIVRRTGYSRGLVRRILHEQRSDVFHTRESSLELLPLWLDAQRGAGYRNGAELWRQLGQPGFRGSLRVVTEWATRRRRTETIEGGALNRTPSARLMTIALELSRSETVLIAAIESPRSWRRRDHRCLPEHDLQEGVDFRREVTLDFH